jgi:phage terminase large subunit-like protein
MTMHQLQATWALQLCWTKSPQLKLAVFRSGVVLVQAMEQPQHNAWSLQLTFKVMLC